MDQCAGDLTPGTEAAIDFVEIAKLYKQEDTEKYLRSLLPQPPSTGDKATQTPRRQITAV
jgi:hypothetical protein